MSYQMKVPTTISLPPSHKMALILKAQREGMHMNTIITHWIEKYAADDLEEAKNQIKGG